ncbi:transposase [Moraxella bovis]|nr:transposase [Moraxella bovis]
MYHEPLTYHLHDLDFKVSLINPAFIKHHADGLGGGVRQKTDKKDSTILAKYGRATHPDTWITPSDDARQILGLDMMGFDMMSFLKIIIFSFFYP